MRNIPFSPPDITEAEVRAVSEVLRSGWITTGPKTKEFEKRIAEYCGADRAACLNSATAAMECTLRILGIGEGDEVITSAYTYTASASVIAHTGATIKLCDVAPGSFEMDYDRLADMITDKTKAIIAVDIAGKICDYDRIFDIVNSKSSMFVPSSEYQSALGRIAVIADAAHSFGSVKDGKRAGIHADFTCFSFHAVKNLTTAEGGAAVWRANPNINSDELYRLYMLQSLHGQNKDALAKTKAGAWEYDIVAPLYKCNMTDIMAAIGLCQLDRYEKMLGVRRKIIDIYNGQLNGAPFILPPTSGENYRSNGHLYLLRIGGISPERRNEIIEKMSGRGIACNVHYKPLPMLTAYKNLGFDIKDYRNAYDMFANEITLPLNSKMSEDDAFYTAEELKKIVG